MYHMVGIRYGVKRPELERVEKVLAQWRSTLVKKKEEYGMDPSATGAGGGDNRVREFDNL